MESILSGNRDGVVADTIKLLDYFKTGEPTDEFTVSLQNRVEQIRCDDEWRENHMTLEMKMDEMFDKGVRLESSVAWNVAWLRQNRNFHFIQQICHFV